VSLVLRADQSGDLPSLRDLIVSPGFAGAAALLAAVIALCAVLYGSRRAGKRFQQQLEQRERHHEAARDDAEYAVVVARCWDRWRWVVETAGIEPAVSEGATLGLGPAVTLELLRGLLRDAEQLDDETLAKAVAVYQEQLLLVLAQQGGPLAELATATSARLANGKPDNKPASTEGRKPDTATTTAVGEPSSATVEESGGGRRRR
jgi:hypothetical protein